MDLATIQSTVAAWAADQSGGLPIYWQGSPQPMQLKPRVELDGPLVIEPIGQDWLLWEPAAVPGGVVSTVVGNRELTVIVRTVGRSAAGNMRAQYWLERLRGSLKKPSVLEHFHDNGVAIVRCGPTAQYDAPVDSRIESIAAMELRLACTIAESDTATDTIDTVRLSSYIQDTAGIVLPVPPNLDNAPIGG